MDKESRYSLMGMSTMENGKKAKWMEKESLCSTLGMSTKDASLKASNMAEAH